MMSTLTRVTAQSPITNRGKLFKQTGPLLTVIYRSRKISMCKLNFFRKSLFLSAYIIASSAYSQSGTGNVTITGLRTGWNADQVAVIISGAIPNPAGCSMPDSFILNTTTPGYKTHYAAILTAMSLGRQVQIVVAPTGCLAERPVLWGITIN